jgi:hypothetical protein
MIGFSTENGELEDLTTLNSLDIAKLNELIVIVTWFIKCVEENCLSCFNILPIFHKL